LYPVLFPDVVFISKTGSQAEVDNGGVIGLPTWDGFNPLGEIVGGC